MGRRAKIGLKPLSQETCPYNRLYVFRREGNSKKAALKQYFCLRPIVKIQSVFLFSDIFLYASAFEKSVKRKLSDQKRKIRIIMDKTVTSLGSGIKLTEKEKKLIEMIRALKFGEMRIIIQESEPVRVEEIKNSIKL